MLFVQNTKGLGVRGSHGMSLWKSTRGGCSLNMLSLLLGMEHKSSFDVTNTVETHLKDHFSVCFGFK